jgi:hypothetical protein
MDERDSTLNMTDGIIRQLSYNKEESTLCITFKDGSVYTYFEISEDIFKGLVGAKDKDGFFMRKIRNKYKRLFKAFNLEVLRK